MVFRVIKKLVKIKIKILKTAKKLEYVIKLWGEL